MTSFRIVVIILSLVFLLNPDLSACKCDPIKRESYVAVGLKYSDIIFLGELIDSTSDNHYFSFKILEIFKGSYKNKIIKGCATNSCSLYPTDKGLWLIYANFQKDSLIDIGLCGPSVALINPGLYCPPPKYFGDKSETKQLEWEIEGLNKKIDAFTSWNSDLYKLREYKLSNINEKTRAKIDYQLVILVISLILNIFMFILVIKKINASRQQQNTRKSGSVDLLKGN